MDIVKVSFGESESNNNLSDGTYSDISPCATGGLFPENVVEMYSAFYWTEYKKLITYFCLSFTNTVGVQRGVFLEETMENIDFDKLIQDLKNESFKNVVESLLSTIEKGSPEAYSLVCLGRLIGHWDIIQRISPVYDDDVKNAHGIVGLLNKLKGSKGGE